MALYNIGNGVGVIIYVKNPYTIKLDRLVLWLASATFYMPAVDSSPTVSDVLSNGMDNLETAVIAKTILPKLDYGLTFSDDTSELILYCPPVKLLDVTGSIKYLAVSDVLGNLVWAHDLSYSNSIITVSHRTVVLSGLNKSQFNVLSIVRNT